jgi:hypothetical protein
MPTKVNAAMSQDLLRTDIANQSMNLKTALDNVGVNTNFPFGLICIWPLSNTATIPSGWLPCNGGSKTVANYPDLFAIIGYTFGGSGANFSMPTLTPPTGMNYIIRASTILRAEA